MFKSQSSNLLFSNISTLNLQDESYLFRRKRLERYQSVQDLMKTVEKQSRSEEQQLMPKSRKKIQYKIEKQRSTKKLQYKIELPTALPTSTRLNLSDIYKFESQKVLGVQTDRVFSSADIFKPIKKSKFRQQKERCSIQKVNIEKKIIIQQSAQVQQQEEINLKLKNFLKKKMNYQQLRFQECRNKVTQVENLIAKLIDTRQIIELDENKRLEDFKKLMARPVLPLIVKQKPIDFQEIIQNLPESKKGTLSDPNRYSALYDDIYSEKYQEHNSKKIEQATASRLPFQTQGLKKQQKFNQFIFTSFAIRNNRRVPNFVKI